MPSFNAIPILDLARARDAQTKPAFLADLRRALLEVGFLYIANAGVPAELVARVIQEGKAFFEVPEVEKYVSSLFFLRFECFIDLYFFGYSLLNV